MHPIVLRRYTFQSTAPAHTLSIVQRRYIPFPLYCACAYPFHCIVPVCTLSIVLRWHIPFPLYCAGTHPFHCTALVHTLSMALCRYVLFPLYCAGTYPFHGASSVHLPLYCGGTLSNVLRRYIFHVVPHWYKFVCTLSIVLHRYKPIPLYCAGTHPFRCMRRYCTYPSQCTVCCVGNFFVLRLVRRAVLPLPLLLLLLMLP